MKEIKTTKNTEQEKIKLLNSEINAFKYLPFGEELLFVLEDTTSGKGVGYKLDDGRIIWKN